jgi:hypothetical protein
MAKVIKDEVVALRLTTSEKEEISKAIKTALDSNELVGAGSVGLLGRKLLLDFARNKLRWVSKRDKKYAPEVAAAELKPQSVAA